MMILGLVPGLTAQGPIYHWYHGDSLLLVDKPDGLEVLRKVPLYGNEALSTYTTPDGALIYYSNGVRVFNREDSSLLNSESLLTTGSTFGGTTVSQGVLFLPQPGDLGGRYTYVLMYTSTVGILGWCFSLIDANMDSGLGGIDDAAMNVPFSLEATEQLHAVQHENGQDWWIYTRSRSMDSSSYIRRTLLDSTGFHAFPPIDIGVTAPSDIGEIISSPNGCFLAEIGTLPVSGTWHSHVAIFDLCRFTGNVVLKQFIDYPNGGYYGGAFSPSSEILYVVKFLPLPDQIVQISFMDTLINIETVYEVPNGVYFNIGEAERSRDGRVYFGVEAVGPFLYDSVNYHLGAIKSPDLLGLDCDVDPFYLNLGKRLTRAWLTDLPNFVLSETPCDTGGVEPPDTTGTWLTNFIVDKAFITPTFSTGLFFLADWVQPDGELSVYSITGRLEQKGTIHVSRLDLGHLPEGMFFVELIQESRRFVQRIMILR